MISPLALIPYRLFPYPDTPLHQILVVEQQMLLQSGVGQATGVGNLLYCQVRIATQEFESFGILLLAERTSTTRKAVIDSQPCPYLLAPLNYPGIVRAQLPAQVRAFQPEFTRNLRDVALDMLHASARLDCILVFDPGSRQLSSELVQFDFTSSLLITQDVVACQHQVTVVSEYVTSQSVFCQTAHSTDFRTRQIRRTI